MNYEPQTLNHRVIIGFGICHLNSLKTSFLALPGLGGTEKKKEPESSKKEEDSEVSPKTGGKSTGPPKTGGKSSESPNAGEKHSDPPKTGEQSEKPEPSSFYSFLKR